MTDGEARGRAGAGESDEVLGGDVGDKQRRANEEPADVAAREKVIGGGAFFPGEVESDTKNDEEVDADDRQVEGCQSAMGNRGGWIHECSNWPPLLNFKCPRERFFCNPLNEQMDTV